MNRGTEEHPFRNIIELRDGIRGRTNCTLYTYGTWELPKELSEELKLRNIKLLGVMVAYIDSNKFVNNLEKIIINGTSLTTSKGLLKSMGGIK